MRLMRWRITRCAPHSAATPCGPPCGPRPPSATAATAAASTAESATRAPALWATTWSARPAESSGSALVPESHCRHFRIRLALRAARPAGLRKSARRDLAHGNCSDHLNGVRGGGLSELFARFRIILFFRPVFGGILILAVQAHLLKRAPPAPSGPGPPPLRPPSACAARHCRRRFSRRESEAALLFAAVAVEFDAAGAAPLAPGAPDGADFALSFAGGALGVLAAFSATGGAVIAASVPTSNFRSTGVFVPEARSISLVAGAKPSWEISTRKWPAGSAGNSNFPSSSVQVIHAFPVDV